MSYRHNFLVCFVFVMGKALSGNYPVCGQFLYFNVVVGFVYSLYEQL